MSGFEPFAELDTRYSHESATASPWSAAKELLTRAEMYWLSTVRPDGRPHVTPLIGVWAEDALHFSTGASERKGRNLAANPEVVLTTGNNTLSEGIDVVVEGRAERVTDGDRLNRLAAAWESKYGPEWHFDVQDGTFRHAGHVALVFEVSPRTAFGFGKGTTYSQTRWRFS
ncbi:pyridoxamine 5'-phosphate oxidase family protein [Streptomyces atratus]|uniref:pyridoxamine 5'-phosphate oxidase family protein n=1 Tax=Streptomyces atratus TaxID=1893 RepID=UPI00224E06D2|nr:pyridoxamine 5'-phosphate oxidase family protein [Streptomyces atratus]MCX5343971.1 pyridoxamine 5'-phosphate oxidase family protein [Streptomyces atratus]